MRKSKAHEHIIGVPPTAGYNLKGFADLLEKVEDKAREKNNETLRAKDNPRDGYDYNDPWYDERHSNFSIIDTPRDGSRLNRDDIMEALWHFGCPMKYIKAEYSTTSIFIPMWVNPYLEKLIRDTDKWSPFNYESNALREFLPYMESIFIDTANISKNEKPLSAFVFNDQLSLKIDPNHTVDEGPAVDIIRSENQKHIESILEKSDTILRSFLYEYGLCLMEIIVKPSKNGLSIRDSQWLEHFITLTPFETLLGNIIDTFELKAEIPHKHFACTTLTKFNYQGGHLRKGRSIGGGIQMMVSDVEPIFKNLPFNTELQTQQTVIDETSKRYFYCSSTSILNFDDVANFEEHNVAHITSSVLFNMVLAQRFILSKIPSGYRFS